MNTSSLDNWQALDNLLHRKGTDTAVPSRKVANHTYAQRRSESIAIKLHNTDVLTFGRDGSIVLNSGGWLTVTTKERMNAFLPRFVRVHTVKGRWLVAHLRRDGLAGGPCFDNPAPFADDMVLTPMRDATGWLTGEYSATGCTSDAQRMREDAHNKQIEKLLDRWLRTLTHDHIRPSWTGSDQSTTCTLCLPVPGQGSRPSTIGEQMGDTQHLIEHLFEKQYPLHLMQHATRIANPSGARIAHLTLLKRDLRNYLRPTLLIGPISIRGGKRANQAA